MSHVNLPVENLDKNNQLKVKYQKKAAWQDIYLLTRHIKMLYVSMRKYLCNSEECLCLNFLSCVKNTSKFIKNKNNDTDDSQDCLLGEENDPNKIIEFVTILHLWQ